MARKTKTGAPRKAARTRGKAGPSQPPRAAGASRSERPRAAVPEADAAALASWQERADKDAYALDLLDRLTRYFGGRASASAEPTLRAAAEILNALAFGLAAEDVALLDGLRQRARELRHGAASERARDAADKPRA